MMEAGFSQGLMHVPGPQRWCRHVASAPRLSCSSESHLNKIGGRVKVVHGQRRHPDFLSGVGPPAPCSSVLTAVASCKRAGASSAVRIVAPSLLFTQMTDPCGVAPTFSRRNCHQSGWASAAPPQTQRPYSPHICALESEFMSVHLMCQICA